MSNLTRFAFPGARACDRGVCAHRAARAGPAHRDRGGDRLRERLDHARPAHGVRGALRQEPLRAAFEGYRRRRDHAGAESEELTKACLRSLFL